MKTQTVPHNTQRLNPDYHNSATLNDSLDPRPRTA
jgi:hypothetical protein